MPSETHGRRARDQSRSEMQKGDDFLPFDVICIFGRPPDDNKQLPDARKGEKSTTSLPGHVERSNWYQNDRANFICEEMKSNFGSKTGVLDEDFWILRLKISDRSSGMPTSIFDKLRYIHEA